MTFKKRQRVIPSHIVTRNLAPTLFATCVNIVPARSFAHSPWGADGRYVPITVSRTVLPSIPAPSASRLRMTFKKTPTCHSEATRRRGAGHAFQGYPTRLSAMGTFRQTGPHAQWAARNLAPTNRPLPPLPTSPCQGEGFCSLCPLCVFAVNPISTARGWGMKAPANIKKAHGLR